MNLVGATGRDGAGGPKAFAFVWKRGKLPHAPTKHTHCIHHPRCWHPHRRHDPTFASADVTSGDRPVLVPIDTCRIADTRAAPNTVGPRSTPLGPAETITLDAQQASTDCTGQIPATASALSLNVTISYNAGLGRYEITFTDFDFSVNSDVASVTATTAGVNATYSSADSETLVVSLTRISDGAAVQAPFTIIV